MRHLLAVLLVGCISPVAFSASAHSACTRADWHSATSEAMAIFDGIGKELQDAKTTEAWNAFAYKAGERLSSQSNKIPAACRALVAAIAGNTSSALEKMKPSEDWHDALALYTMVINTVTVVIDAQP